MQRVELYFREAEVPEDKRGQELASLLDDEPFRIVSQMGLLNFYSGIDYAAVKECCHAKIVPGENCTGRYTFRNQNCTARYNFSCEKYL